MLADTRWPGASWCGHGGTGRPLIPRYYIHNYNLNLMTTYGHNYY